MGVAETRFRRVATVVVLVTLVATGAADAQAILHQGPYLAAWWWYPALALNVGVVAAFLVLPWVAVRWLRTVSAVYAIGSLLVLATIPFAGTLPDDLGSVWPLRMISTFGLAAALAFGTRGLWIYLGVLMVVSFFAVWSGTGDAHLAIETDLVNLSVAVPLALILLVVLRTGRALDAAAASAIEAARSDAASAAAALERRRVELLAHDDILYTLRVTALGLPTRDLARTSLARLSQVDDPGEADLVTRLRSMTAQLAPAAGFGMTGSGEPPPPVADALVEATGEALRNSVLHAPGATLRVDVDIAGGRSSVRITDDGPGFRPSRLPVGRLGVARSIIARMESLPGGSARVRSAPGKGTIVELGWTA